MVGQDTCISYQSDGRLSPRCGSLQRMGEPLFVFIPLTAQLLLPLSLSGLVTALILRVSFFCRYRESLPAGAFTRIPGIRVIVSAGIIGSRESCDIGNILLYVS